MKSPENCKQLKRGQQERIRCGKKSGIEIEKRVRRTRDVNDLHFVRGGGGGPRWGLLDTFCSG